MGPRFRATVFLCKSFEGRPPTPKRFSASLVWAVDQNLGSAPFPMELQSLPAHNSKTFCPFGLTPPTHPQGFKKIHLQKNWNCNRSCLSTLTWQVQIISKSKQTHDPRMTKVTIQNGSTNITSNKKWQKTLTTGNCHCQNVFSTSRRVQAVLISFWFFLK